MRGLYLGTVKSLARPEVDENSPPGPGLVPGTVRQLPVKEAWTNDSASPKVLSLLGML